MPDQDDFYRKLLNNLGEGVYFADRERRITFWNKAAERITGFREGEVVGRYCRDNILSHVDGDGRCLCVDACPLAETIADGKTRESEIYLHHKEGHRVPVLIRSTPITNDAGEIVGAVEVFSDNSAKRLLDERLNELQALALLDPLTRLPNRRFLETHLQARLEELRRNQWPFGVMFIDVDHFKSVNDRYGHEAGDETLKMVARTLAGHARSFDVIGRWGGEEFLAVIANSPDNRRLVEIGNRLRVLVERSGMRQYPDLHVTLSIGASLARAEDSVETLLRRSDDLLYQAKAAGRNRVCI